LEQWHTKLAGCRTANHPPKSETKKKTTKAFCRQVDISNILRDLPFGINQPLKLADGYFIIILRNVRKTWKCVDIQGDPKDSVHLIIIHVFLASLLDSI
jgi:hypothetical protein